MKKSLNKRFACLQLFFSTVFSQLMLLSFYFSVSELAILGNTNSGIFVRTDFHWSMFVMFFLAVLPLINYMMWRSAVVAYIFVLGCWPVAKCTGVFGSSFFALYPAAAFLSCLIFALTWRRGLEFQMAGIAPARTLALVPLAITLVALAHPSS